MTIKIDVKKQRCRCTYEAGDSECPMHPTCSECGVPMPNATLVPDSPLRCEACAATWTEAKQ